MQPRDLGLQRRHAGALGQLDLDDVLLQVVRIRDQAGCAGGADIGAVGRNADQALSVFAVGYDADLVLSYLEESYRHHKRGEADQMIQLGITFIGFLAAAFAGASIAGQLADWLRDIGPLSGSADVLALLIVTLLVSLATIVFGELVPKTLGMAHAERYALTLARPMELPPPASGRSQS